MYDNKCWLLSDVKCCVSFINARGRTDQVGGARADGPKLGVRLSAKDASGDVAEHPSPLPTQSHMYSTTHFTRTITSACPVGIRTRLLSSASNPALGVHPASPTKTPPTPEPAPPRQLDSGQPSFLCQDRLSALRVPGLRFRDGKEAGVGQGSKGTRELSKADLVSPEQGGRETSRVK